jgi:drug/metabolite transporter (DMT)-like permease
MGDLLALISALCWAAANVTIGLGIRSHRGGKGADNGAFLSILLTTVLAALVWVGGGLHLGWPAFNLPGILWFAAAGVLTIFLGRVLLYSSIRWLGAIRGASLKRLVPLFSVLLGVFILGESLSRMLVIGMALIFAGFAVLLQESLVKTQATPSNMQSDTPASTPAAPTTAAKPWSNPGFVYGTISALVYAAGNVARKFGILHLPDPAFGAMFGSLVGTALFVLIGTCVSSYGVAVRNTFTRFNPWLLAAGVLGSAGQVLFFFAIDYTTVSRAAMVVSAEVFLTILLNMLLLRGGEREKLTTSVIIAAVLGAIGTLVILADKPPDHAPAVHARDGQETLRVSAVRGSSVPVSPTH